MLAHSSGIFLNLDFPLSKENHPFILSSHFFCNKLSFWKYVVHVISKVLEFAATPFSVKQA